MADPHQRQSSQLSSYYLGKTIGKGTFGKVKKAIHKITSQPVAIKILEKQKIKDITDIQRVNRQLHILKFVRHSSIAQLYQIIQTAENIFIVMEFAQNGEFFDFIMDGKVESQDQAHCYFMQILGGIEYLHSNRISHRDIKPQNMLLDSHNQIKIVDFGLSNMYEANQKLTTACGSPCYASPQMIKGQQYDPVLTDIWSLGVVLYAMIFARLPFEDENTSILYSKIKAGLYIVDKKISLQLKSLLSGMLSVKVNTRLSLKKIKEHPWIQNKQKIPTHGIMIGYDKIPIDQLIISQMVETLPKLGMKISEYQLRKQLENNVKNSATSTYYLLIKRNFKLGLASSADICNPKFNQNMLKYQKKRVIRHKSFNVMAMYQKIGYNDYQKGKTSDIQAQNIKQVRKKAQSLYRSTQYDDKRSTSKKRNQIQKYQGFNHRYLLTKNTQQESYKKIRRLKTQNDVYYHSGDKPINRRQIHIDNYSTIKKRLKTETSKLQKESLSKDKNIVVQLSKDTKINKNLTKIKAVIGIKKQQDKKVDLNGIFWKKKSVDHREGKKMQKYGRIKM